MRTHHRADEVISFRVVNPVADGFIGGIFQGAAARFGRSDFGAQHLHARHIGRLPCHVDFTHINHALQSHKCRHGGGGHAVLPGARFGNNPFFTQMLRHEDLSDGVVDFVGTGMGQIFPFQENVSAVF